MFTPPNDTDDRVAVNVTLKFDEFRDMEPEQVRNLLDTRFKSAYLTMVDWFDMHGVEVPLESVV